MVPSPPPNISLHKHLPLTVFLSKLPNIILTHREDDLSEHKIACTGSAVQKREDREFCLSTIRQLDIHTISFIYIYIYIYMCVSVYVPLYKFNIAYQLTCHLVSLSSIIIFLQLYIFYFVQMSRMAILAFCARQGFDSDVRPEMCGQLCLSQCLVL